MIWTVRREEIVVRMSRSSVQPPVRDTVEQQLHLGFVSVMQNVLLFHISAAEILRHNVQWNLQQEVHLFHLFIFIFVFHCLTLKNLTGVTNLGFLVMSALGT